MDRNLLANATTADDSPTPGYMLTEIARATTANYQANVQLQDYLVARLGKSNHNIKYKCLVIIKHVCRTGRAEFKREMGRHVETIKECLQYRGPPDPLRGDEIYKRVRDAAREAIDAIFDSQMPVTTSAVAAANRIQGMGNAYVPTENNQQQSRSSMPTEMLKNMVSSVHNKVMGDGTDIRYEGHPGAQGSFSGAGAGTGTGTGAGNSYNAGGGYTGAAGAGVSSGADAGGGNSAGIYTSSSGMSGLGNPNFSDARYEKTWLQKAKDVAMDVAASSSSTVASMMRTNSGGSGSGAGGGSGAGFASGSGSFRDAGPGTYNQNPVNNNSFTNKGVGEYTYATNRGVNAFGANSSYGSGPFGNSATAAAPGGSVRAGTDGTAPSAGIVPDMPNKGDGQGRAGAAATDGAYERSMVAALCEPGGLKPVPPEEKLQDFLRSASTLSEDIIGNCLLDMLNSDAWQSRTKALIVIGKLAKLPDDRAHLEFWQENVEELKALTQDSKAGVRTQAVRTLKIVDPASASASIPGTGATANTAAPVPRRPASNLGSGVPVKEVQSLLDTEDFLSSPMSAISATSASTDAFDSISPAAATAAATATAGLADTGSMFAGMSISPSPGSPVPTPTTANAQLPPAAPVLPAAAAVTTQPPAAPVDPMSHFDFLNADAADTPSHAAPAPAPAAASVTSDMFGGMNISSAAPSSTTTTTAATATATASSGAPQSQSYANELASLTMTGTGGPVMMMPSTGLRGGPMMMMPPMQQTHMQQPQMQQLPGGPNGNPNIMNRPAPNNAFGGQPNMAPGGYQMQGSGPPAQFNGSTTAPNASIIAPGMLSHAAPRKSIPSADDVGPSGFTFIAGGGGGSAGGGGRSGSGGGRRPSTEDSFSFVTDQIKAAHNK